MPEGQTTASVQRYLDALAGDKPAEAIVRVLLDRAVRRLQVLCAKHVAPPLCALDEATAESSKRRNAWRGSLNACLKALRATRPTTVARFFCACKSTHAVGIETTSRADWIASRRRRITRWGSSFTAASSSGSEKKLRGDRLLASD